MPQSKFFLGNIRNSTTLIAGTLPEVLGTLQENRNAIIKYVKTHQITPSTHYHTHTTEITYIIKGKICSRIGEEIHIFTVGDYFIISPNIPYACLEILEPLEAIVVHTPGIDFDDRVYIP